MSYCDNTRPLFPGFTIHLHWHHGSIFDSDLKYRLYCYWKKMLKFSKRMVNMHSMSHVDLIETILHITTISGQKWSKENQQTWPSKLGFSPMNWVKAQTSELDRIYNWRENFVLTSEAYYSRLKNKSYRWKNKCSWQTFVCFFILWQRNKSASSSICIVLLPNKSYHATDIK